MNLRNALSIVAALTLLPGCAARAPHRAGGVGHPPSILISGARIADGTGQPLRDADVRIEGDSIAEVGSLTPREGETVVAGAGLVLAPGFIDVHNHSTGGLKSDPAAETQVSQGITTLVLGSRRRLPLADRGVPAGAARRAGRGQRHDDGGTRDGPLPRHGRGLQARGDAGGGREDGGARRAGACARARWACPPASSTTSAATARPTSSSRSARPPRAYGGFYMTHVRDEADKSLRGVRGGDRDRASAPACRSRSRTSSSRRSACGARRRRPWPSIERGARQGRRRHGRLLSLRGVALGPLHPGARTSSTSTRRASSAGSATSEAPRTSPSPPARRIRPTRAATSSRSRAPRASRPRSSSPGSSATAAPTSSATP